MGLSLTVRERARWRGGGGRERERQGDLLTFSEQRFSLEKKGPIAYGVAVILYHQRRIITICAAACGRQLIMCQKRLYARWLSW